MKLSVKTSSGLPYARKEAYEYDNQKFEADLKTGDTVRILDSGEVETGQFGEQTVFKIKTRNGDKKFPFNQKTINVLVQEFGEDTENWVNKEVRVILHKGIFGGKKGIAGYLVTDGWQLDEYSELVKTINQQLKVQGVDTTKKEGDNGFISVDSIPF